MEVVTKIAPIALALIMLTLGLGLTTSDFTRVIKQPKDFLVGLICQVILLPIIAFVLIKILNVQPALALGVMIIAAAPGGVTSNILTKFANGDVALSVSLTAIISLLSILTVPFIVIQSADLLNINYFTQQISMSGISIKMFLVVTLPVLIGMLIRKLANEFIITYLSRAGTITLILNITMITLGFYVAKIFASGIAQRKCISLECGLQNGTLAVFVSTQLFDDVIYLIPTASYALIMFVTSIIFVLLLGKVN